jgi:hypothetical protein
MAFQSDKVAFRTWDPDTGWELKWVTKGPDYPTFELWHPKNGMLRFCHEVVWQVRIDGVTADGAPRHHRRLCIHAERAERESEEERARIHAALDAFGGFYSGSLGPLELQFDGDH